MRPSTHPEKYQDVKVTLRWFAAVGLAISALLIYIFLLPDAHKEAVDSLISQLPTAQIIGSGIALLLLGVVGWFLIFFFEVHDKIYDAKIIKWRYQYDLDFIIPRLYWPFGANLDSHFLKSAEGAIKDFIGPYYLFVGDTARHKISQNLITRFYEAVTKYWITQINELLLIFTLLLTVAYYFVYQSLELPTDTPVEVIAILAILFVMNRYLVRVTRREVRRKTIDEIDEIHSEFLAELEDALAALQATRGLAYPVNPAAIGDQKSED